MALGLTPEHLELAAAVRGWAERHCPVDVPRAASGQPDGGGQQYRDTLGPSLAAQGVLGLHLPEKHGGQGYGLPELAVAIEELGRALLHGPHLDTLTAAALVAAAGPSPLLDRLTSGELPAALGPPGPVRGRRDAEPVLSGGRLEGTVPFVGWAASVALLVLGARDAAGEPLLLAVPLPAEGVELRRQDEISRGELYEARLAGVPVPPESVLLRGGAATAAWRAATPAARLRHAAYLVGMAQGALDATLEFVRRRQAFGRRLGSFQSLAFRLAALHARIDAVRLFVRAVAWGPDGAEMELRAHQAHGLAVEVADDAATEGLQMHGAYGLTEAAAIQRYYRHCAMERARLGRPADVRADMRAAFVRLRAAAQPE